MVPSITSDTYCFLCIDLVLPMGWVNSLDFFCSYSETLTDNYNTYTLNPNSLFDIYLPTSEAYHTSAALPASPDQLQYIDIYMDNILCATQGDSAQQQRISELILRALNEIISSVPGDIKD